MSCREPYTTVGGPDDVSTGGLVGGAAASGGLWPELKRNDGTGGVVGGGGEAWEALRELGSGGDGVGGDGGVGG